MRSLAKDLSVKSGKVELAGWVNSRRDHGGLIFIDLRDHTGVIQLVIDPQTKDAFELAEHLRDEYVIRAEGTVRQRGEGLENPNIPTGNIEVVVESMELLNRSGKPVRFVCEDLRDGEGNPIDCANHPMMPLRMRLRAAERLSILRKIKT